MFTKKGTQVHKLVLEQVKDVQECLIHFEGFLRAACTGDTGYDALRSLCDAVSKAEAAADGSLRRMIDSLANESFLPSTKEDIIAVATSCDAVANKCEALAQKIVFQHFRFPAEYAEDLLEILSISHKQFETLEQSISQLFSQFGALLKDHAILDEIRSAEHQIDVIEQKMYDKVYSTDMDLAHQMQIAKFIGMLCDISDIVEDIADKIQIMLVTRKA